MNAVYTFELGNGQIVEYEAESLIAAMDARKRDYPDESWTIKFNGQLRRARYDQNTNS